MHERTTDAAETAVPLPERQGRSYTPGESERGKAMTSVEAGRLAGRPAVSREPFGRAERLHLGVLAGVFVLLAAMLSAGAIAFTSLSGQILGIRAEVREEIGGLRAEMREEIGKLSDRMDRLSDRMDRLSDRVDQLSNRMDQLSNRMTRVETLIETHLVPASNAQGPAGP